MSRLKLSRLKRHKDSIADRVFARKIFFYIQWISNEESECQCAEKLQREEKD